MRGIAVSLAVLALTSCAYPRRSTSLSAVSDVANIQAPADLWRLRFTTAVIPPRQRGDSDWDEDGTPPDVFVRVYRDDEQLYESEPRADSLAPRWQEAVTPNVLLPARGALRIELWDSEPLRLPEPIGVWRGRGLPASALPGADARIMLEGTAELLFQVLPPEAFRGTGITEYEVRSDALLVISLIELSPAGRAGITEGTQIVAIDGETIAELGEAHAAGKLSMASSRQSRLTIVHGDGRREDVQLDAGYVWRAR